MSMLEVKGLSKSYGRESILADITLTVDEGEFVSIVGPSGAGKTTMLKCLSGLLPFEGGSVTIAGEDVVGPPETLGLVFQDYSRSLLPWLSVKDNVKLPLRYRRMSNEEREAATLDAIDSVGLGAHSTKKPWPLSGGMQQRVAIARALAYKPRLLLMDEPFASVDAQTRIELEDLTLSLWSERKMTIGFVTHDIDESIYLGNRIVVLSRTPTTIRKIIPVDLPWPRDQLTTKGEPDFARLRAEVFEALGHEHVTVGEGKAIRR